MFHTNTRFSKTLKKKINKAMENHITKALQFDGNCLKPEYTSEIDISYIKINHPQKNLMFQNITFK